MTNGPTAMPHRTSPTSAIAPPRPHAAKGAEVEDDRKCAHDPTADGFGDAGLYGDGAAIGKEAIARVGEKSQYRYEIKRRRKGQADDHRSEERSGAEDLIT